MKGIIRNLAYSIAGQVYGVGSQYIRKCLDKKYKRKYQKKVSEENTLAFVVYKKKVLEDELETASLLTTTKEVELAVQLYKATIKNETLEEEWKLLRQQNEHLRQENQKIRANRYRLEKRIREL